MKYKPFLFCMLLLSIPQKCLCIPLFPSSLYVLLKKIQDFVVQHIPEYDDFSYFEEDEVHEIEEIRENIRIIIETTED